MGWAFGFGVICLLVFLFIKHTKWTLISLAGLVGVTVVTGGSYWLYTAYLAPKNHVTVLTTLDLERCTGFYPVLVQIENNSNKFLDQTTVKLKHARKNSSPTGWRTFNIDINTIIPPDHTYRNCHAYGDLTDAIREFGEFDVYIILDGTRYEFAKTAYPPEAIVNRTDQLRKQAAIAKAAARAKKAGEEKYQDYQVLEGPDGTEYAFPSTTSFNEMRPVFVLDWHGEDAVYGQVEPKK